jgi:hypothetical protein
MTRPAQRATGRTHIPGLDDDQAPAELIEAYWLAIDLSSSGWRAKRLDFDAHTATAFVIAHTPTRRTVTVTWDLRGNRAARQQVPAHAPSRRLIDLAQAVASLGQNDAETGEERLTQLCWLVQSQVGSPHRHHRHWRRVEVLPTLPANQQPMTRARAAAWLIARLEGKYGWCVRHLGEDIAGGGFIADIPGDVQAIFPATMEYDGTAAAALARLLPQVPPDDLRLLSRLDYRALWAAGQAAGGRR